MVHEGNVVREPLVKLSTKNINFIYRHCNKVHPRPRKFRCNFRFVSLVAPIANVLEKGYVDADYRVKSKRSLVKKSYLILSWLYYLVTYRSTKQSKLPKITPKIAILPPKQNKYTLTKAPMAHKTNSKEQFLFKFYNFKFSFAMRIDDSRCPTSVLQGAQVLSMTKSTFPVFETNLLFLKHFNVVHSLCDATFFGKLGHY